MVTIKVDVLISGAGPTGLLLGYILARMGVKTLVVEQQSLEIKQTYGRASTLYPRTLEMLDQLDLLDEMNQIGFIGRNSVTYKNGKRVQGRGWQHMFKQADESYLNYLLNIRQKYSETVFLGRYKQCGGEARYSTRLKNFTIEGSVKREVISIIEDEASSTTTKVISKYLIGADGGNSTVRDLAGIPFHRDQTTLRWVRIDGVMKTDMPDSNFGFGAVESPTHGNVLWVNLDHGRNRVGYAVSKQMYEKYGDEMTQEQAIEEAKIALAPFQLDVNSVEWWTVYSIKQGVADTFFSDNCIFLAGDACHVHSSGAAQGMNVGVHDAVNLGWKLGGVIRGTLNKEVLLTYEAERRPAALELIRLDKAFSSLISGSIPEEYRRTSTTVDPNALLVKVFDESLPFTTGLGVHYDENILNWTPTTGNIQAGWRAPDALLYAPGAQIPIRLCQLTKNIGSFWMLLFVGEPLRTKAQIQTAHNYIDSNAARFEKGDTVKMMTIIGGTSSLADSALGASPFGYAYYDPDHTAHVRYGMSMTSGGLVVLRPDGILGFATSLNNLSEMDNYFQRLSLYS